MYKVERIPVNVEVERVPVYVEVEVSTLQQRERREKAQQRKQIEPDAVIDWRSYDRRAIPNRWRVS